MGGAPACLPPPSPDPALLRAQAAMGGGHRWAWAAGPQPAFPLPPSSDPAPRPAWFWGTWTGRFLLQMGGWGAPMQPWRPGSEGQLPHPSLTSQSPPRSHSHLQELVQEEGKPIGQHLLCHRLCPGEAEGMRGSPSWRAPKRVPGFLGGLSPKRTQGWEPGHCVLSRLHPSSKTRDLGPEAFAF